MFSTDFNDSLHLYFLYLFIITAYHVYTVTSGYADQKMSERMD